LREKERDWQGRESKWVMETPSSQDLDNSYLEREGPIRARERSERERQRAREQAKKNAEKKLEGKKTSSRNGEK
jgi:hypothetical protein